MARRKKRVKRTKRFGSPYESHVRSANHAIKESVRHSRAAFQMARSGQCSRALDALSNAENLLGEARGHEESAGHGDMSKYNKAGTIKVKAGVAFRRMCIKGGK